MLRKIVTLFSVLLTCCGSSFSQTPFNITDQRIFSGDQTDVFGKVLPISSQKTWVIGHTKASEELDHQSISNGESDIWLIEEENNSISWEKSIGAPQDELLHDAIVDKDGNVVLLSRSNSPVGGDKSDNSFGLYDLWVVKLDQEGNILWNKTFGGNQNDIPARILDYGSGYLLLANSGSSISGNKAVPQIGNTDIWIVSIDYDGNVTNQKVIGTTEYEEVEDAVLLNDHEILISTSSFGLENNSKTEPHYGGSDCWLVKYDFIDDTVSNQVSLGGLESELGSRIKIIDDHIYVVMTSRSGISGSKTSPGYFQGDIWLVKLDKELEVKSQNTFGGNRLDLAIQICYNLDASSNLFLLGNTESNASTGLKEVNNFGEKDVYFVEVDKDNLAQISDTVFGGVSDDYANYARNTFNGFELLLTSESGVTGNKTLPLKSFRDQWLINLEFEPNSITEMGGDKEFYIFPNPANGQIQLNGINKATGYSIYDAQSRIISQGVYSPNDVLSVEELASGIYFLRLEGYIKVEKLLVR